jgi:hypothetical protein
VRERRANERHACRIACQVHVGKQRHDATLVDVSRSGLSIRIGVELAQAEPVELTVDAELRIQAIAWRINRTRTGFLVGMMLSEVTPAYEALVGRADRRRPRRATPPIIAGYARLVAEPEPKAEPPPRESWWRLRVKECDGPRTRNVTLSAATQALAIDKALLEIGPGWEVLEARPTKPIEHSDS